ncbi:MAG: tRNA uridine-5-carboxymethylaminomethyl(34) synthesis GTPase MnmE [bacterium]
MSREPGIELTVRNETKAESTIVAIVTPRGKSGLAVVRMSGSRAIDIARNIFRNPDFQNSCESHRAYHGTIFWPIDTIMSSEFTRSVIAGQDLDDVVLLPMIAPKSYTGEDSVEIFCHGGIVPPKLVMAVCLAEGATVAGPGEFSRRAFLNGKLSLDQAEAVADLIHAEDERTAGVALKQIQKGLKKELEKIGNPLKALLAEIEGSLEFVEEEVIQVDQERIFAVVDNAVACCDQLLRYASTGKRIRDGVQVVIAGPPNVGKSSLMNGLLGEERSIVDHQAGTTRDIVKEVRRRDGYTFIVHDTAGLRISGERIEEIGIRKTRTSLENADIVLLLSELGRATEDDYPERDNANTDVQSTIRDSATIITVLTKADLVEEKYRHKQEKQVLGLITSAITGEGMDTVWAKIIECVDETAIQEVFAAGALLNVRHRRKLEKCRKDLVDLQKIQGQTAAGDEVLATMLATILSDLDEISGRVYSERLLDDVFGRFCVGK